MKSEGKDFCQVKHDQNDVNMKINFPTYIQIKTVEFFLTVLVMIDGLEIQVPINYTALAGDLEVHVQDLPSQNTVYYLQLLEYYPSDNSKTILTSTPLSFDYNSSAASETSVIWKAKFPCGVVTQGGRYAVRIHMNQRNQEDSGNYNEVMSGYGNDAAEVMESATAIQDDKEVLIREPQNKDTKSYVAQLDVRWPSASLTFEPNEIQTYPDKTVTATLMFQSSYCEPGIGSLVPETWLTLIYCGQSIVECKPDNKSHSYQALYSEQIRGYPTLRIISLHCQLFGQAGYYALMLTTGIHGSGSIIAITTEGFILKAVWSEKFVFNVHARSIFRCDAHSGGVAVLFQYPECILNNDKVRLFGRLRADVASIMPPTSLEYITEQKVFKGKHSLFFDCELFSEKYVEYCFVYVSQAITGAVSDVRIDCIPTFPISEKDAGRWGMWSPWSPCTTSCKGGTRNRYRFCDSPPPRYGAKFCEGHALETQECGNDTSWECQMYSGMSPDILATSQDIKDEVGLGCQCGCVVHLSTMNPKRLLAASTKICPKKALWLIQAEQNYVVQLHIDQIRLPCSVQKLKIHDGEFVSSNLLAQFTSTETILSNFSIISNSPYLLLELLSSDLVDEHECIGGFLCHIQQIVGVLNASRISSKEVTFFPLEAVHLAIAMILLVVVTMSICMVVQYVDRYYKYQRASNHDDITDTDISECSKYRTNAVMSHETSMSTLVEEAIPLRRMDNDNKSFVYVRDNDHCSEVKLTSSFLEKEKSNLLKNKRDSAVQTSCFDISGLYAEKTNDMYQEDFNIENRASKLMLTSLSTADETLSMTSPTLRDAESLERRPSADTQASIESSISSALSSKTAVSSSRSMKGSMLKRVKDLQNREKMVAGSDFSLTGQDTDLEMDYYDYNVNNTSEVPGSYLGMDPLYCVWIPPFAPGQWVDERSDNDSFTSSTDNIEMKVICRSENDAKKNDNEEFGNRRSKLQEEYELSPYEKYKRFSNVSTTSSGNKTLVPEEGETPDEKLTIKDAIIPDPPVNVQRAVVVKDKELKDHLYSSYDALDAENLKYADDESSSEEYHSDSVLGNDFTNEEGLLKGNECVIENVSKRQVRFYK